MKLADTLLDWLALISLILAAWTFLAFLTATAWHLARQAVRRRAYSQAIREVGEDTLDMLARAARDWPHESHAWGPKHERMATPADEALPYLAAGAGDIAEWEAEYARYRAARLRQEGSGR